MADQPIDELWADRRAAEAAGDAEGVRQADAALRAIADARAAPARDARMRPPPRSPVRRLLRRRGARTLLVLLAAFTVQLVIIGTTAGWGRGAVAGAAVGALIVAAAVHLAAEPNRPHDPDAASEALAHNYVRGEGGMG